MVYEYVLLGDWQVVYGRIRILFATLAPHRAAGVTPYGHI